MSLKPAIFLQIQKTAGSTFVEIPRSAYGNENVISHGNFFEGLGFFPLLPNGFFSEELILKKFKKKLFISGHFGYDFSKPFKKDRYSFTFLRNPVERVLFFYFFCKSRNPREFEIYELSQKLCLNDFLSSQFPQILPFIWNCQVNSLAHGFGAAKSLSATENEKLNLATDHLDQFSYVGFAETYKSDRDNILSELGVPIPNDNRVVNAIPGRPQFRDLPGTTQKLLLELTQLDRQLYQEAWSRKKSPFKKLPFNG